MGAMYWLRIVMMTAILVVVIWTMRRLNNGKVAESHFSVCPARVSWVETPAGIHIEEHNGKWMRTVNGSSMQEVDPIAVEKWFSRLCMIALDKTEGHWDFQPVLKLGYITGATQEVLKSRVGDEYQLQGQTFRSKDLDDALHTLPTLPDADSLGHN